MAKFAITLKREQYGYIEIDAASKEDAQEKINEMYLDGKLEKALTEFESLAFSVSDEI